MRNNKCMKFLKKQNVQWKGRKEKDTIKNIWCRFPKELSKIAEMKNISLKLKSKWREWTVIRCDFKDKDEEITQMQQRYKGIEKEES
jgi:hypothetical protein